MGAPLPRWSNTAVRLVLALVGATVVGVPTLLMLFMRTPYVSREGLPVVQPVPFDHRHHVGDDLIDCRYCHSSVEKAPSAGLPSTSTCMNCHGQVWPDSPLLEPVRNAYFTGRPIEWRRVHDLPDYVYFNHAVHLAKGVGCATCHGRVDQMPAVMQVRPLTMGWCLDCHRDPVPHLRPREAVVDMEWKPPPGGGLQQQLRERYAVDAPVHCSACHR